MHKRPKEFIWLAVLTACDEAIATHPIAKSRNAEGTDPRSNSPSASAPSPRARRTLLAPRENGGRTRTYRAALGSCRRAAASRAAWWRWRWLPCTPRATDGQHMLPGASDLRFGGGDNLAIIIPPESSQTLPDWTRRCPRCGKLPRPVPGEGQERGRTTGPLRFLPKRMGERARWYVRATRCCAMER